MSINEPHGINCILPPYIVDHMAALTDPKLRRLAMDVIDSAAAARAMRSLYATMPRMAAIPSPQQKKHRLVYDLGGQGMWALPGKLVRGEGDKAAKDAAVNEAYTHAGYVYDFYKSSYGRNSLDSNGMSLISSVHLGKKHNNAYWNGEQMVYGDGDGVQFVRFTKSLDVVGHEFSHGVVTHTCNLVYQSEPGALNEHFADVMGVLVRQWKKKESAKTADWTIGKDCLGPTVKASGLRTFLAGKAFEDDPILGTDPQPKHIKDKYTGSADNAGVHINSGIPNHAFYLACYDVGGNAWEKVGQVWYDTLTLLGPNSAFVDMVNKTLHAAAARFGVGSAVAKSVEKGWKGVGLL